jgi:hypothetical protein
MSDQNDQIVASLKEIIKKIKTSTCTPNQIHVAKEFITNFQDEKSSSPEDKSLATEQNKELMKYLFTGWYFHHNFSGPC